MHMRQTRGEDWSTCTGHYCNHGTRALTIAREESLCTHMPMKYKQLHSQDWHVCCTRRTGMSARQEISGLLEGAKSTASR